MYFSQFSKKLKSSENNSQNSLSSIITELSLNFYQTNRSRIASIIKEHHNVRITNTLTNVYIDLAVNHEFTIDPVVQQIREMNIHDIVIPGKIHYKLKDNSVISISEETQKTINKVLHNNNEAIEFMKESSENFLKILDVILREE